jgi:anti-sigma regulatory factor (Ser/Thr protein kinase)
MILRLAFKSDPAALCNVRKDVRRFLEEAGCPAAATDRILLALTEACTNVIRHTYGGDPARSIRLACGKIRGGLRFRLRDYGPRLDAAKLRVHRARELKPGGLGLPLMHATFDTIQLVNHPRGNELVLITKNAK